MEVPTEMSTDVLMKVEKVFIILEVESLEQLLAIKNNTFSTFINTAPEGLC